MSDYLSNLVARSLSAAEVIRPRLASLFEPLQPTGGPASVHPLGLEMVDGEPASGETTSGVPSPPQPPLGLSVAPPMTSLRPSCEPGQQPGGLSAIPGWVPSQPGPGPTPPQIPVAIPLPAAVQPFAMRALRQPESDRPTLPPAAARDEAGAVSSRSAAEGRPQPALEPAIQHIVTERVVRSAEPPPTIAPRHESPSMETTRPSTPAMVVAQPHVKPYVEPAAPVSAEPAEALEPTPTIQVTIGRVEVRATPPPAPPPKKQRSKPPVMSLDEYLRQRAGGDRQ